MYRTLPIIMSLKFHYHLTNKTNPPSTINQRFNGWFIQTHTHFLVNILHSCGKSHNINYVLCNIYLLLNHSFDITTSPTLKHRVVAVADINKHHYTKQSLLQFTIRLRR